MRTSQEDKEIVESWLKDLSKELGTELVFESGVCSLIVGEGQVIAIELLEEFPMVSLYGPLIPFPAEEKDVQMLMIRALEMNALQLITRGGSIGVLPGGSLFIYSFSLPIKGVDSEEFSNVLLQVHETILDIKNFMEEETEISETGAHIKRPSPSGIKV